VRTYCSLFGIYRTRYLTANSALFVQFYPMSIHIGTIIKDLVRQKGMDVTEFAQRISYTRRNAYKIFNKPSIDTDLLARISAVLGENLFFKYLSDEELSGYSNNRIKPSEVISALNDLKAAVNSIKEGKSKKVRAKTKPKAKKIMKKGKKR
jgi:hypothetical protein